jgi:hypothetical protein
MLKHTTMIITAAMVMSLAHGQDDVTRKNIEQNMQNSNQQMGYLQQHNMMPVRTMQDRGYTQSDLENWSDYSPWMNDVYRGLTPRDAVVLKHMLNRMPANEERAVRVALQKCHTGSDSMYSSSQIWQNYMSRQNQNNQDTNWSSMHTRKFMMNDADIWNNTMDGLTIYERRQLGWVWNNMLPSERDALMAAFRTCHEAHWMRANSY